MSDGDSSSIAAQLGKLEALRSSGALSEAEFQKLKSALVAQGAIAPKASGTVAWLVGALAAVAVVIAVIADGADHSHSGTPISFGNSDLASTNSALTR
jgi:hypothetical protein